MRKAILILALVIGAAAIFSGLAVGALMLLAILIAGGLSAFDLLTSTVGFAIAAVGLGLGALLTWQAGGALSGRPGPRFAMPRWGWWLLAFALVVSIGQWFVSGEIGFFVPALHVLAAIIPPFCYLALASAALRRGRGTAARSTWGSLAWGGLGGVGLGVLVEILALVFLVVVIMVALSVARPDLLAQWEAWAAEIERGGGSFDPSSLEALTSPLVVLGLLLFASGFVPLVEELAKSLAVPIVAMLGRRPTRLDGFLLGAAAGAGFAMVEGIFNGAIGLAEPTGWAGAMLVRAGAAAMHCLASGLFGLGWQAAISERRLLRGAGLALASMTLHGLWNAGAVATALSGLLRPTVGFGALGLRNIQGFFIGAALAALWLLAVAALAWLPRHLAEE